MVSFPPLFPSAYWFSGYLAFLGEGKTEEEAITGANSLLKSPKEFGRFVLENSKGEKETLSVAVKGGSRQLRSFDKIAGLQLSEHGDWRKIHIRAIEAVVGRSPFYRYFEEGLLKVLRNRDIQNLGDFNMAIFEQLKSFLMKNIQASHLKEIEREERLRERGKEIAGTIKPEISLLQTMSFLGPEALIGLKSFSF